MSMLISDFFKPSKARKDETKRRSEEAPEREKKKPRPEEEIPQHVVVSNAVAANRRAAERKRAVALLASLRDAEWRRALEPEADAPYLFNLSHFITAERASHAVFPPAESVFAALDACPLSRVKVVVVGQDPYHGQGQANGLAFSIAPDSKCRFPPSLRNILNELDSDLAEAQDHHRDDDDDAKKQTKKTQGTPRGDLTKWARQGVVLLNTVLTVRSGAANSHQNKGWERFTDAVIRAIATRGGADGKGVVFLLWGKPALAKCANISKKKHRVILSSHPSPLSNTKTASPFTGSRCFSRCNALLAELGYDDLIDWSL